MKKSILLVLFFLSLRLFSQVIDDNRILNQFIVMLKPAVGVDELIKFFPSLQIKQCLSKRMNIWLVERNNPSGAEQFLAVLQKNNLIKLAQFNHAIRQRALIPNDINFNSQWNMLNTGTPGADIDAADAWQINHNNITANGDTIVVAIIDGTFDLTHPDLNFFVNHHEIPGNNNDDDGNGYTDDYYGWDVYDTSGNINWNGGDNHAMHCSGIAGAIGNDSIGVAGVCWGVKILRVSGASQTESQVVAAYAYVVAMRALYNSTHGAKGAFIVSTNSSFGIGNGGAHPADYPVWCAMYDSMGAYGVLSAAAAPDAYVNVDNISDIPTGCPSNYLISVTNTNSSDHLYSQAAIGKVTIDIGAPGTHIYSTITSGEYGFMTGTSMSSPHIAGAVASMFAAACPQLIDDYYAHPDSIALIIKQMMLEGATQVSDLHNETVSGGRLNLYHAVKNVEEYNCNRCKDTITLLAAQPSCSNTCDGSAQVMTSGTGYHSYNWNTETDTTSALQHLCPGFYSVTITDTAGCQQVRNFSLFGPDSIIISSIYTVPVMSGNSGNIVISATAGNDTLAYSLNGINYQIPSTDNTITFLISQNGVYNVYVKNENGCVVQRSVEVTTTGTDNILTVNNWTIYPNPAGASINISFNQLQDAEMRFTVLNVLGETLVDETKQTTLGAHTATVDISSLAAGIYFMQISEGGVSSTRRFVVAK